MHASRPIHRFEKGRIVQTNDAVTVEAPLEIRVRSQAISVSMRTPGDDAALAAGFLLGEGVIHSAGDIHAIEPCPRPAGSGEHTNVLNVFLKPHVAFDPTKLTRHVFASSSCGVCGKATIDSLLQQIEPVQANASIQTQTLGALPEDLRKRQASFNRTGGLHAAALYTTDGQHVDTHEDVGRHNAVDKALGAALLSGRTPLNAHLLMLSGRAPFEIIQKAAAAGVPIIAAIGAPSSLAVELAEEMNQTLIGFLKRERFNIYTHPHRVA